MPTLTQVRDAIDARLATLWTTQIVPKQDAYFVAYGKYWQGIITTPLASLPDNPSNGIPVLLEVIPTLTGHPTDQSETWADAQINLGVTIPMALEIHAYGGALGQGYVGIVYCRWNGNIYTKRQNSGPETWRTADWALV